MLGKLIKHEFKAVNRLMIPMHLGLILITIVGRFYVQFVMNQSAALDSFRTYYIWESIINVLLVSFYFIALVGIGIITSLYLCILRFRKNLFTDEGYLMHTLPASASDHILSKLIVAFTWLVVDVLLLILSVLAMFVNADFLKSFAEVWTELMASFPDVFGVPSFLGISIFLLLVILDTVSSILIVYMCIAVGHSFNNHKILSSIGIYVGITVLSNLITSIFMALSGFYNYNSGLSMFVGISITNSLSSSAYFWANFFFNAAGCIILAVGSFLITNYFMTKRLNLE